MGQCLIILKHLFGNKNNCIYSVLIDNSFKHQAIKNQDKQQLNRKVEEIESRPPTS